MRWLPFILIFLLIYIESTLFVRVASELGVLLTLLLVLFTSCVGISLVRNQGVKNFIQLQQKLVAGESPAVEMIKSVSLVLAGFLLLLPGFFTDFLGLLLLLPPVQKTLVMKLMPHINFYRPHNRNGFKQGGNTFEGEYERKQDDSSHTLNDHKRDDDEHKPR
ncbi:FxsA family protein [Photorhabdus heterorhabditis]|uniref:Exclusion suppressor FxsA n=1 Tax=Photorhabdus heterorhabditis TaxID=880156 RepID=A0A5B0X8L4_9GAMM|nr:FxsA family protein [Photorhabdus heterorhabditis]KAA1195676.1 FxsA family protein [Photorhabdus heterorhabditis]KOY60595.1 exclusion suppressor FxsA [Photorhabdus heterorhabditis]MBS9440832.1 FxsA family protein [Photorhabdus heterorhabditis]